MLGGELRDVFDRYPPSQEPAPPGLPDMILFTQVWVGVERGVNPLHVGMICWWVGNGGESLAFSPSR